MVFEFFPKDKLKNCFFVETRKKSLNCVVFPLSPLNAFIVFLSHHTPEPGAELKLFRINHAQEWIAAAPDELNRRGRKFPPELTTTSFKRFVPFETRFAETKHLPERGTSRRCQYCSTKKKPHRTRWSCNICKVGLCLKPDSSCFYDYHQQRT
uniref:PiggyBac transposable element-derived protein 4 C-terminal zinc-ribbon domain-containing protein n=1 Tax=Cacopsylla melanoneura TaxID=428564 RepID=A0A8D9ALR4_9HEMI